MKRLPAMVLALSAFSSQALEVTRLSPQGDVAQVNQVVVKFDEPVVNFGDPKAPAPMGLSCSDTPAAQGTGRWTSDREWVFDFTNELPAASACTLQVRPGLQSLKGTALTGRSQYTFKTGGLRVLSVQPDENTAIDEEQFFILQLNGPATLASVQASIGGQVEGLGERVAVRLIDGQERAAFLKSRGTRRAQAATHAVINWLNILQRMPDVPERDKRIAEANQILKSRISTQGTQLVFSTEKDDYWWWLMQNGDVNAARLMLAVMDSPAWKDDMGRLATGLLGRQSKGAWRTTTANLWGSLAVEKFATKFDATPVTGSTQASTRSGSASVNWQKAGAAPDLFLPWAAPAQPDSLNVTHTGTGKPWLTVQSIAAIDLKAPFSAGYQIKKTITPMEQANKNLPAGSYTRGDVLRVTLEINASTDMSWAVITDPVPGGASILGGGLGRDSDIATQGEKTSGEGWPAFEERSFETWRGYYAYLPKGITRVHYTLRLNTVGDFSLPPSRAEAMYAPEMFGESPNGRIKVLAGQ